MRANGFWVAAIAGLMLAERSIAADGYCDACSPWGHHARRCAEKRAELYANCGCNGSYKYPVPPLSTYHWPGMYSAQLMTDYHSPWRFLR